MADCESHWRIVVCGGRTKFQLEISFGVPNSKPGVWMRSLQRRVVAVGVSVGMAFAGLVASAPAEVTPVVVHGAMTKGASRTAGSRLASQPKALEAAAAEAAANAV